MSHRRLHLLILVGLVGFPAFLPACSVPVFRYALEHWMPDTYEALILHQGKLTADERAVVDRLRTRTQASPKPNLNLRDVELSAPESAAARALWESLGSPALPQVLVRPGNHPRLPWFNLLQPLTPAATEHLTESPARTEFARRIANEDSVVWVLLESGNQTADAAARERLDERLNYLASVLKLPELSAADIANGLVSVGAEGLRLRFSSLAVSRSDPAENFFTRLLLSLESDLHGITEPMVFPIFGQGRALMPLVGAGINNAMIDAAAIFLVGKCSCELKEENPGIDLLMTADWTGMVKRQANGAFMAAAKPAPQAVPELVTFSAPDPTPPPATPAEEPPRSIWAIPLFSLFAGVLWFCFRKRLPPDPAL